MLSEGEHICPVCGLAVEGLEAYEEHMGKRHVPGRRIFVDSFVTALDDMPRADQKYARKVLTVLQGLKRYSIFEATANNGIAKTMDLLLERGLIERTGGLYPWCEFVVTEAGRRVIDGGPVLAKVDHDFDGMVRVGPRTYVSASIAKAKGFVEWKESK